MVTDSKHGHYKISLDVFSVACVGVFFFTVTRAKKTEQDEHNNGYNELQSEWNGVRLAKSLLSLFLKGNNCTQRYYDPNWTGLTFFMFVCFFVISF